uniref:Uncharacterized protein n=1 Tax=Rhizophora mucronata TaxID=61149 RepID=A0A2P2QZX2_RHIMU
MDGLCLSSFC